MTALPVNSIVASVIRLAPTSLLIKGYAIGSSDVRIVRMEVSVDDGMTWQQARITYQAGKWSWTLWDLLLENAADSGVIFSRAIDERGNTQARGGVWNIRGVAFNPWGRGTW